MITEQQLMPQLSVTDPITKAITITLSTALMKDGVEISRINNSMTFQSNQMNEVKSFLGVDSSPEIDYLNSIWN